MAKFRMEHEKGGKSGVSALIRVLGLGFMLFLLLYLGFQWVKNMPLAPDDWMPAGPEARYFLPGADSTIEVIHFPWFSTGVSKQSRKTIWAACEWDARMEKPEIIPDTLFPALSPPMLSLWREWMGKGQEAARRLGRLFVVTGVPEAGQFYMVWLDEGVSQLEAAGLVFQSAEPRVVSVDSIEFLTGLDLFADYWLDSLENEVEKRVNQAHWAPQIP